jgi:hypothetical protein
MDLNTQKEQFSIAYVGDVAAVAGVKFLRSDVEDDSIDILKRTSACASAPLSVSRLRMYPQLAQELLLQSN